MNTIFDFEKRQSDKIMKGFSNADDILEKGKKFVVGTIHNGYKKIAEGKWQKVSKHGLTKKEHFDKVESHQKSMAQAAKDNDDDLLRHHEDKEREHYDEGVKLDNKEYDDDHVMGKKEKLDMNKNREPKHNYIADDSWEDEDSKKFKKNEKTD